MGRGGSESIWLRRGNGIRLIARLPYEEMVVTPCGDTLALVPAEWIGTRRDAAFTDLLWRHYLMRYGHEATRAQFRAWLRDEIAA